MREWRGTLVWLGVLALAAASLAASSGEISWMLELVSHFRPHLVALCFIWLFVALFQHRPVAVAASAALLALNTAPIMPYVTAQPQDTVADASPLRIMTFDMRGRQTRHAAFLDYVRAAQPDVISLTEVPPDHAWLTDGLGAEYRHRFGGTTGMPHDLMLFSRWPIQATQTDRSVSREFPVLAADLCREDQAGGACVRLVGLHAIAPIGSRFTEWHAAQLAATLRFAAAAPHGQAIVAGNLNMTPWSPNFRRLLQGGGLRDAALGRSIAATWISRQPMVGLAVDHILASPGIGVRHYDVGPDLGSDHLPVIAELAVPRQGGGAIYPPR